MMRGRQTEQDDGDRNWHDKWNKTAENWVQHEMTNGHKNGELGSERDDEWSETREMGSERDDRAIGRHEVIGVLGVCGGVDWGDGARAIFLSRAWVGRQVRRTTSPLHSDRHTAHNWELKEKRVMRNCATTRSAGAKRDPQQASASGLKTDTFSILRDSQRHVTCLTIHNNECLKHSAAGQVVDTRGLGRPDKCPIGAS